MTATPCTQVRDYRDGVIETLALSEAQALRRIADLTLERDAYRELLSVALERLHQAGGQLDRLREQHHRLVVECRSLRERVMREAERASHERTARGRDALGRGHDERSSQ